MLRPLRFRYPGGLYHPPGRPLVLITTLFWLTVSIEGRAAGGTLVVWGTGKTNYPAGLTNVVAIATKTAHSLVLRSDGTLAGWGYNADGEATGFSKGGGSRLSTMPPDEDINASTGLVTIGGQVLSNITAISVGALALAPVARTACPRMERCRVCSLFRCAPGSCPLR
jgi:hypothetical protein